ncbi:hypothetical protein AAG906_000715 [Vitis piasezkii]
MLCKVLLKTSESESITDLDNEDDINQLDSSSEISSQTSSDQEECVKGNCNCRPKTINVISQDQELKSIVKPEVKKIIYPYNLNEILNKFDQQSPKEVSIKDLHEKVRQYRKEINELRQFIKNLVDIPESSQVNDDETDVFFNTVSRVIFQRWEVSLTIVVKDKFVFDIVALIDSGAVENCLQEGVVPIQLCEETSQSLFGANGKRLAIKYKLTDVHIRNHDICIKQTFILVKDLNEKALLGIPFLSSIYPMWVDNQGNPRETSFVKIKHNVDKFNLDLAFFTCHIYKILTVKQWSGNPNFSRDIAWIVQWDYIIIADESTAFPTLRRTFKTKWWDTLKNDASLEAVKQYFLKHPTQASASDDMSQFLLKEQQLQAMLAVAKTPQEFQKILDEGSLSFSQENSYAKSDDSTSYLPDNGDDCEFCLLACTSTVQEMACQPFFPPKHLPTFGSYGWILTRNTIFFKNYFLILNNSKNIFKTTI